ncbi:MAG: HNH endonuclease [Nanoarchaeota archaeon]
MKKYENPRKITKKYLKKIEKRDSKKKFKEWSMKVRERDEYKCVICKTDKFIHAHHIIPKEIKEFRFNINNGVSLCAKHHKYSFQISAHKNPVMFIFWLQNNRGEQWELLNKMLFL